jgi:hypothetical protein
MNNKLFMFNSFGVEEILSFVPIRVQSFQDFRILKSIGNGLGFKFSKSYVKTPLSILTLFTIFVSKCIGLTK